MNKLGSYISKLMTTILDKEQEGFVKDLALDELRRLNVNVEEFVRKHSMDMFEKEQKKQEEKQLLQEDKNVKDK